MIKKNKGSRSLSRADFVRYMLPPDEKRIFAAKYKFVLPTEEQLLAELPRE